MNSRRSRFALTWALALSATAIMGAVYAWVTGARPVVGVINGAAIGGLIAALELFVIARPWGAWVRRRPLIVFIVIVSFLWLAAIFAVLESADAILGHPWGATPEMHPHGDIFKDTIVVLAFAFLINFALRIQSLIGPRILINFLIGRYYRPKREERAVVFIDLADSTALAERLGDLRVQEIIARFFFDIARPIEEYGGEIHRYVGDAVIVTWPLESAERNSEPLQCVLAIQDLIDHRAAHYQHAFGTVPRFRTGAHAGPVVASEVGDTHREVVYFGDTMNTAARLQQKCKELDKEFLVSEAFINTIGKVKDVEIENLGNVSITGKAEKLHIFSLSAIRIDRPLTDVNLNGDPLLQI